MPLTREEMADIDRMLSRMDRKARRCRSWGPVLGGVVSLGSAAYMFRMAANAYSWMVPEPPIDPLDVLVVVYGGMGAVVAYFFGLGTLLVGIWMLMSLPDLWEKGHRDRLLVRMARCWLETQEPASPGERYGGEPGDASEGE